MSKALKIEYLAPSALKARSGNPRQHSEAQIAKLVEAIREFGFKVPVGIDADNTLIWGHGRTEAAKQLGLSEIPAIRITDLTPAQVKALVIADNQLAQLSSWDEELLRSELKDLVLDQEISFAPTITGFECEEIDALVFGADHALADPADEPLAEEPPRVAQVGDVWSAHGLTLVCGDALQASSYKAALGSERADLVLTDPPYNVAINGHVSGKGKVKHSEFVQASGEMSEAEFIAFLATVLSLSQQRMRSGALVYSFMDGAHLFDLLSAARQAGLTQKAFCTWAKTNAGMGGFYRSQTEHVLVLKNGSAPHTNNIKLGRFGRNRTTLWTYPGANAFGRNRDAALALHPTVKPVGLLADVMLDATHRDALVLDPFAGSGSTLIAAHRTNRRAAGIELDPRYIDGAIARIEALTELRFERQDGALWAELAAEVEP